MLWEEKNCERLLEVSQKTEWMFAWKERECVFLWLLFLGKWMKSCLISKHNCNRWQLQEWTTRPKMKNKCWDFNQCGRYAITL